MRRLLCPALLGLLFCCLACSPSLLIVPPPAGSQPQQAKPASNGETRPAVADPPGESQPSPQAGSEAISPAPRPASTEISSQAPEAGPIEEPYTDQNRIDDALDIYQEALDYWNHGDPDRAIQSLDQCYQIIASIENGKDPEITQQKEDLRLLISKRILEIYASRSHPQIGRNREIPLVVNEYVAREIKRFEGPERRSFIEAYRRSGQYRPYIAEQMRKAGLPEELSWLPLIESGFKIKALSKARALGLWQFIASTAYRFDLRRDRWVDERMDPQRSTQAAITYLKALHDLFGDWTTVLAAYNCGEGNVLRVIRQQHVNYLDDFWDLYLRLPPETARYVPRFLAALHLIKDPKKYGFSDLELAPPVRSQKVAINRQMRLKDVARALNLPVKVLEELNPCLRYKVTPDYPFTLKVPPEAAGVLLAKVEEIPQWKPPRRAYIIHRVRFGETLSEIALKHRVPVRRIVRANRLRSASRIRAGQRLKIPLRGRVIVADRDPRPFPQSDRALYYRVKPGDSLWRIARHFNTSVAKIKALNGIRSDLLHSGQLLRIGRRSP